MRRRRGSLRRFAVLLGLVSALAASLIPASSAIARPNAPGTLVMQAVPPLAGIPIQVGRRVATTDAKGVARLDVPTFVGLDGQITLPQTQIGKDRTVVLDRVRGNPENGRPVEVGLRTRRLVDWTFLRPDGATFPVSDVTSMTVKSNTGEKITVTGADLKAPMWVSEMRTVQTTQGLQVKENYWVVETVVIGGTTAVNRSQQRFTPAQQTHWDVNLLLYNLRLSGQDLLFSTPRGEALSVERPDGVILHVPFGPDGSATVEDLPRGSYLVRVSGGGVSFERPVSVSRDTTDTLAVISYLDIGVVLGLGLLVAVSLLLAGRPRAVSWGLATMRSALGAVVSVRPATARRLADSFITAAQGARTAVHRVRIPLVTARQSARTPSRPALLLSEKVRRLGEENADIHFTELQGSFSGVRVFAIEDPRQDAAHARANGTDLVSTALPAMRIVSLKVSDLPVDDQEVIDVSVVREATDDPTDTDGPTDTDDPAGDTGDHPDGEPGDDDPTDTDDPAGDTGDHPDGEPGDDDSPDADDLPREIALSRVQLVPAVRTASGLGRDSTSLDHPGEENVGQGDVTGTPSGVEASATTESARRVPLRARLRALPLIPRPRASSPMGRVMMLRRSAVSTRVVLAIIAVAIVVVSGSDRAFATSTGGTGERTAARAATAGRVVQAGSNTGHPTPVLAYYYIWFNPTSWNRAKIDYPLLGRYDSDDPEIMRRHIVAAKDAGIDGFLVSWKHTKILDDRLRTLISVARSEHFSLGIVYQGLDFQRDPLALDVVRSDLEYFVSTFAADPVFQIFDKPVVIWTGSYRHTPAQINDTVGSLRGRLNVLAAARTVSDYTASASVLDGEAYYWSSMDPSTSSTATKMSKMAEAVRANKGLWIAPASPGYDGRSLGGSRVIDRRGGATLRESLQVAVDTQPDAIGLISWNEFSENTYVEPSKQYGARDLQVLADFLGVQRSVKAPTDSSEMPRASYRGLTSWGALLVIVSGGSILFIVGRARRRRARSAADIDRLLEDIERNGAETR
jgi:hypothetical protein